MKKITIFIIGLICLASFGLAGWLVSVRTNITGNIVSLNGNEILVFTTPFEDFETLDTTSGDASTNQSIILQNNNGVFENMLVSINTIFEDETDLCTPDPGECEVKFLLDGDLIENGSRVTIYSGENNIVSVLSCKRLSCPAEVNSSIIFSE